MDNDNKKYSFRLHVTIAEIEERIDNVIKTTTRSFIGDELQSQVYQPLLETFENRPERLKHNSYKRAYAKGYTAGRIKQYNLIGD